WDRNASTASFCPSAPRAAAAATRTAGLGSSSAATSGASAARLCVFPSERAAPTRRRKSAPETTSRASDVRSSAVETGTDENVTARAVTRDAVKRPIPQSDLRGWLRCTRLPHSFFLWTELVRKGRVSLSYK